MRGGANSKQSNDLRRWTSSRTWQNSQAKVLSPPFGSDQVIDTDLSSASCPNTAKNFAKGWNESGPAAEWPQMILPN